MPVTALQATKILCESRDWTLTHLQIQKILYLCHMYKLMLTEGKEGLFRGEPFQAWNYGPVIPEVYHEVKMFGAEPVLDIFGHINIRIANQDDKQFIKRIGAPMGEFSASDLVGMTHRPGGAWDRCFKPGRNVPIPDEYIYQEVLDTMSDSPHGTATSIG